MGWNVYFKKGNPVFWGYWGANEKTWVKINLQPQKGGGFADSPKKRGDGFHR